MDAEIQARDDHSLATEVFDLDPVETQALSSMDAGFRHPCRNDEAFSQNENGCSISAQTKAFSENC
jgi:hypothetical protein